MNISVEVPVATCDKCGTQASLRPQYLCPNEPDKTTALTGFNAIDENGEIWRVVTSLRPKGWTAGPDAGTNLERGLCAGCDAAWKSFLSASPLTFSAPVPTALRPTARLERPAPTMPKLPARAPRLKPRDIRPTPPTWTSPTPQMADAPETPNIQTRPVAAPAIVANAIPSSAKAAPVGAIPVHSTPQPVMKANAPVAALAAAVQPVPSTTHRVLMSQGAPASTTKTDVQPVPSTTDRVSVAQDAPASMTRTAVQNEIHAPLPSSNIAQISSSPPSAPAAPAAAQSTPITVEKPMPTSQPPTLPAGIRVSSTPIAATVRPIPIAQPWTPAAPKNIQSSPIAAPVRSMPNIQSSQPAARVTVNASPIAASAKPAMVSTSQQTGWNRTSVGALPPPPVASVAKTSPIVGGSQRVSMSTSPLRPAPTLVVPLAQSQQQGGWGCEVVEVTPLGQTPMQIGPPPGVGGGGGPGAWKTVVTDVRPLNPTPPKAEAVKVVEEKMQKPAPEGPSRFSLLDVEEGKAAAK